MLVNLKRYAKIKGNQKRVTDRTGNVTYDGKKYISFINVSIRNRIETQFQVSTLNYHRPGLLNPSS